MTVLDHTAPDLALVADIGPLLHRVNAPVGTPTDGLTALCGHRLLGGGTVHRDGYTTRICVTCEDAHQQQKRAAR